MGFLFVFQFPGWSLCPWEIHLQSVFAVFTFITLHISKWNRIMWHEKKNEGRVLILVIGNWMYHIIACLMGRDCLSACLIGSFLSLWVGFARLLLCFHFLIISYTCHWFYWLVCLVYICSVNIVWAGPIKRNMTNCGDFKVNGSYVVQLKNTD